MLDVQNISVLPAYESSWCLRSTAALQESYHIL